jgi:ribosomal-protein-alanine N-acetyltransferase
MSAAPDPSPLSILWATHDHVGAIARLHASLLDTPWDGASIAQLIADPGAIALVARIGDLPEIAGFVLGRVAADEAEILSLGVAAGWQRLGIGGELVAALGRAASRAEAVRLYLEVAEDNVAARALYRRLSFHETGRRNGYYARAGAPPQDAINLSLAL